MKIDGVKTGRTFYHNSNLHENCSHKWIHVHSKSVDKGATQIKIFKCAYCGKKIEED